MAVITIIGSGMMGSALAFPLRENGHEVRLVGTHLDRDIIDACIATNRHPKFERDFPEGLSFHQIEDVKDAIKVLSKNVPNIREMIFTAITHPERYSLFDKYEDQIDKI